MTGIGFDHEKYVAMQSQYIRERFEKFGGKLYLEFGGKLFDDYHASRVLPGFQPDSKVQMLRKLSEQTEIVIVINAADIEKNKVRSDLGITYDSDVLRLIDSFREMGMYVGSVVLTRYAQQPPTPSKSTSRSSVCRCSSIIPSRAIPPRSRRSCLRRAMARTTTSRPCGRSWS
mgnify:CR=1 FL=1